MPDEKRIPGRREFLKTAVAATLAPWACGAGGALAAGAQTYRLIASSANIQLAGAPFPATEGWCFNQVSPGPLLKMQQGQPVSIEVVNRLSQELTVHWHGLRIPNRMDGVPILTQPPIAPGESFLYEYAPPDAGTFWYHSHLNTAEQVGRGLYGPIIVEERGAPPVDRDLLWVLDDWKLDSEARIVDDFDNPRDLARAGRLGNTVTINGRIPEALEVGAGERIRLRLVNAANARIFALRFQAHRSLVIARDGQPLRPYEPGGPVVIGPAQRIDLILDMTGQSGKRYPVIDTYYPQSPAQLTSFVYSRRAVPGKLLEAEYPGLPENSLPEPDPADPWIQSIDLAGGDLGRLEQARLGGELLERTRLYLLGKMWAINGVANQGFADPPLFTVERGRTVILEFRNHTAWPHPMHLHGHHFRVLEHSRDREATGKWMDTVLLGPEESAKVAFVADNPGDWLFHCHILGHARAGMMAVIRVA